MNDTFFLNVDTLGIQVPTRNMSAQDIGDGESLSTAVHRGASYLTQPTYNHFISGARRGINFAIWNEEDSNKILKIHSIDVAPSRGIFTPTPLNEQSNNLVFTRNLHCEGPPANPICLDDVSQNLPEGVKCIINGYCTYFPPFYYRKTHNPMQRGNFNSGKFFTKDFTVGSGSLSFISLYDAKNAISEFDPIIINNNEGCSISYGAVGSFAVHSYEIIFIVNGHTWFIRYTGVPSNIPIAIQNDSAYTIKIVSVNFMEGMPSIKGSSTMNRPNYYLRGINKYINGSGKDMFPIPLSNGVWPDKIKCLASPTVVHEAIPDRIDGKSDHSIPYMSFCGPPLTEASMALIGITVSSGSPYKYFKLNSPIVIYPGSGLGIDNDLPQQEQGTITGVDGSGIQLGFTFTVEDVPSTNEHSYAYMT